MSIPTDASWCWRRILEHREIAQNFTLHLIGNEKQTRFWKDSWHPLGVLFDLFPLALQFDSILIVNATVDSCISENTWDIPHHLRAGNSGDYSLKDTYEALRPVNPQPWWRHLVWFHRCVPRHSFITWITLHHALKTKDKLIGWGVNIDPICSLCGLETENEDHLFLWCHYSQYIWKNLLSLMGFDHQLSSYWESEVQWCAQKFSGTNLITTIRKLSLNAYIYHVWGERNSRIFRREARTQYTMLHIIVEEIRLKLSVQENVIEDTPLARQILHFWDIPVTYKIHAEITCQWQEPYQGAVLINCDGSLNDISGSFRAIIRNHEGVVLATAAGIARRSTMIIYELQELEAGLRLANKYGFKRVCVGTDSQVMVSVFHKPNTKLPWTARYIWRCIKNYVNNLDFFSIKYINRQSNCAADNLASIWPTAEFMEINPGSFSEELKKIILEDKCKKVYYHS
ncbi:Ribonuclease H domain [Macleaya cordata]|uniref:Ribonuclease H domain n=1 Tax=Macleaya cordata TaxID=56857 RepID=A0A200Q542_MACCD|nr:Ribonuclease H domain [Macleaya cordata]